MEKKIAILKGDGIGPEIVTEAMRTLDAVTRRYNHHFTYREGIIGATAIRAVGDPYPEATDTTCRWADAILFGAIGDPTYDNNPTATVRPEQGLLRMRKALGLFANIRPVSLFETLADRSPLKTELVEGVDFVCIRELTGGLYFGEPRGRNEAGTTAFDTCIYSRDEIERILQVAFQTAATRRGKLTLVDKANVLATSRLWRETARAMAPTYPQVELNFMFVDNAAMNLIQNPRQFDVIVTENLFGDILTDEASVLTGSLGMLPSASLGLHCALFEPIHGSYPQAAGKGIANPMATILSTGLLLAHLGLKTEALAVRNAVETALKNGIITEDLVKTGEKAYSTSQVGDYIAKQI